jgi:hypothetical protein
MIESNINGLVLILGSLAALILEDKAPKGFLGLFPGGLRHAFFTPLFIYYDNGAENGVNNCTSPVLASASIH